MNGKQMLYIDQYGLQYMADTVRGLRSQIRLGGSRVSKMYVDKADGSRVHIGYVIGDHWLRGFIPMEVPA